MKKVTASFLIVINLIFNSPIGVALAEEATSSGTPNATNSGELNQLGEIVVPDIDTPVLSIDPQTPESGVIRIPAELQELAKKDFKSSEAVAVSVYNPQSEEVAAEILDAEGNPVEVEIKQIERDNHTILMVSQDPRSFRPGKFELKVTTDQKTTSQDFSWGVLAINFNKTIYSLGETTDFSMAVLDDNGMMVCDAALALEILDPEGNTTKLDTKGNGIMVNPECKIHDFTTKPDYEAHFPVGGEGVYSLSLTAKTANGQHTINDSFRVKQSVDFEVERDLATRIFPPKDYPVSVKITAQKDFQGVVTETVPANFQIISSSSGQSYDNVKRVDIDSFAKADSPSIPDLELPFAGVFNVTERFGDQLHDPLQKGVYQEFGLAGHDGVDFDLPLGTEVLAVDEGEVVKANAEDVYGTTVVVEHSWGRSYYGHLSKLEVEVGQKVSSQQKLGLSGDSGLSTGPHLHFGIRSTSFDIENGYYGKIDPAPYLGLFSDASELAPKTEPEPVQVISWNVDVKKGDSVILSYSFKAPSNSPQFYGLGPLRFLEGGANLIYEESRLWQLAIDAPTNKASVFYLRTTTASSAFSTTGPTAENSTAADLASGSPTSKTTALAMTTNPGTSQASVAGTETSTSAGSIWFRTFLSPRLAPQTINTGTIFRFEGALEENNLLANMNFRIHIYQWREGTGFVASLFDGTGLGTNCGTEPGAATSERNETCITTATGVDAVLADGDQLALEVWVLSNNTSATSFTGTMYFEGNGFIEQAVANSNTVIASAMSQLAVSQTLVLQSDTSNMTVWYPRPLTAASLYGTTGPTSEQSAATDLNSASPTSKTTALAMTDEVGTIQSLVTGAETSTTAASSWFRTFLSPRLAAQTITTGAKFRFEGALAESATGTNAGFTIHVYQWREGTGFIASLIDAPATPTLCGGEPGAANSERNETCLTAATGSDATILAGDQLALEVWVNFNNVAATNWNATFYFGGNVFIGQAVVNNGTVITNAQTKLAISQNLTLLTPTYTQNQFRFYQNVDSVQPTAAFTGENATAYINGAGNPVQLRMNLTVGTANLPVSSEKFKLQFSTSTGGPWTDVGDSAAWCATTNCSTSYTLRRKISFNNTESTTNLANFPVLVILNSGNFDYTNVKAAGADLRFIDSDGTELAYEIEKYNSSGTSYIWVEVPQIDAASTTDYIWMYYGNAGASDASNMAGTWDATVGSATYRVVQHLEEASGTFTDSTGTNNGTASGSVTYGAVGTVDGAVTLPVATTSFVTNTTATNIPHASNFTAEIWAKPTTAATFQDLTMDGDGTTRSWAMENNGGTLSLEITGVSDNACTNATMPAGIWTHVVITYDATTMKCYKNGVLVTSTALTSTSATTQNGYRIGGTFHTGSLDEMRISTGIRTGDWIGAEYKTMTGGFNTINGEQTFTGAWEFFNNPTPADGAAISSVLLSASDVTESYEENNPTIANLTAITTSQDGEWGFALDPTNALTRTSYFFRLVRSTGAVLDTYTNYPKIVIVPLDSLMRHGNWFNLSGVEQTFTF